MESSFIIATRNMHSSAPGPAIPIAVRGEGEADCGPRSRPRMAPAVGTHHPAGARAEAVAGHVAARSRAEPKGRQQQVVDDHRERLGAAVGPLAARAAVGTGIAAPSTACAVMEVSRVEAASAIPSPTISSRQGGRVLPAVLRASAATQPRAPALGAAAATEAARLPRPNDCGRRR